MEKHVWRPLYVIAGIVAAILIARFFLVPEDFGTHEQGYMYGYHRLGNEAEWKEFPSKYQSTAYCGGCHEQNLASLQNSQHGMIPCENCHGAAFDHPEDPPKLVIDRSRDLCLRCHAQLYTPSSGRSAIPGIDPDGHNTDFDCSECHDPHNPSLEEM